MNSLRTLRNKAGLSVTELADAIGVRPVTVYAWENGQNRLQIEPAKAVILALRSAGVVATLDELFASPDKIEQKAA